MKNNFATAMRRALADMRAGDPAAAARTIQAAMALKPHKAAAPHTSANTTDAPTPPEPLAGARPTLARSRPRQPLGEVLASLAASRPNAGQVSGRFAELARSATAPSIPEGARYEWRSHSADAGARDYRLYVPALRTQAPRGLIVMLHGCTQNPDDFARGTEMNEQAERHGLLVAYPAQTQAHNMQGCWNWFRASDQRRGEGEPAILASLTQALMDEFDIARGRAFVAGLSAGGAMAAILAEAYPDLFAAVGLHSGLPVGCAHDAMSAFAVMRGTHAPAAANAGRRNKPARTIIFHGAADTTVHPANADSIARSVRAGLSDVRVHEERAASPGGRGYVRTIVHESGPVPALEHWSVEGVGHAWSGGSASGSYTDPSGPSASAEMVRFFLA